MRVGFLETTREEGDNKWILCLKVLMECLAYLGLVFVVETTYIVEHWHGTGIRWCRRSFLPHLLANLPLLRESYHRKCLETLLGVLRAFALKTLYLT